VLIARYLVAVVAIAGLGLVAGCGSSGRNMVATGRVQEKARTVAASGATVEGDAEAITLCKSKYETDDVTVSAGFTSDLGTVDQWKAARVPRTSPFHPTFSDAELASTARMTVCFVDGDIQAPGPPSPTAAPYTRAIELIDEQGNPVPDVAGTIQSLPIVRPSATAGL
jgi:hypothetical protein